MITQSNAPATAPASPAPSAENNPANAAPAATENGSTLSTEAAPTAEDPDSSEEGYDPFAALDEKGVNAGKDGEMPPEVAPAAEPAAEVPPEPEATPTEEDEEDDEPNGSKPPANNFRVNLKDAADADRKRAALRLFKNEPGITLEEAMRRVGVTPIVATAPTTENKTPATEPAPAAAPVDPLKPLRDEIAGLKTEAKKARGDFDYDKAFDLQEQITEKQSELTRKESVAAVKAEQEQAQQEASRATAEQATWAEVAKEYPDSGKTGTALHTALTQKINATFQTNPGFFDDPDWPSILTGVVAKKLGVKPTAPAAAAPVAPAAPSTTKTTPAAPAVVPRKPSTPVPPSPAPGGVTATGPSASPQGDYDPFEEMDKLGAAEARK